MSVPLWPFSTTDALDCLRSWIDSRAQFVELSPTSCRAYQRLRPLNAEAVPYYEAMRCLRFLVEASERRLARAGPLVPPSRHPMPSPPRRAEGILRRFREISGVTLTLPLAPRRRNIRDDSAGRLLPRSTT